MIAIEDISGETGPETYTDILEVWEEETGYLHKHEAEIV